MRRTGIAALLAGLSLAVALVVASAAVAGEPGGSRPGHGYGDQNHCHTGPPGQGVNVGDCPPPAPGTAPLLQATADPHSSGHFAHFDGQSGEISANETPPRLVPGAPVRGSLSPQNDGFGVAQIGSSASSPAPGALQLLASDPPGVAFLHDTSLETTADFCNAVNCSLPPDTSGADDGQTVLATGNWKSFGALSTDGGASFQLLDPTTIFPSGPTFRLVGGVMRKLDNGLCCDQIVQYVPQIDRFVWLMQFCGTGATCTQGTNKLRIAAATPGNLATGPWTYWDLSSATFGLDTTQNPNMDYPDLAVGNNFLYMSVDNVGKGLLVARIPLSEIGSSSTIHIGFTKPSDSGVAYGGHLTQNVTTTAYWAGHYDNRTLRVFSMREGDDFYAWRDVGIGSWCNGNSSSTTPGGANWLGGSGGFPGSSVLGSTRRVVPESGPTELWFAWTAGHAMASGTPGTCGFSQSHVQIAVVNADGYGLLRQMQVWNPSIAFGYPSLATNSAQEVGMSLGYGGASNDASHAVGFWGDFVVYSTTTSDTSITRYGDYVTIRRSYPDGSLFSAEGYGTKVAKEGNNCPAAVFAAGFGSSQNFCFDPRYVLFGRPQQVPG